MVVRLACEKLEREARFRASSISRFVRRSEGDERIKPLALQSLAVELSFAAGGREVAFREGKKGGCGSRRAAVGLDGRGARPHTVLGGEIQADKMLAFQPIAGNP